ncbi:MAG: tetraacyldisaccharide 4'-kinase [Ramlibacter sp.]|nr:tetraacyldisaccharide 4'-kinase [Ramlibacter sp.]
MPDVQQTLLRAWTGRGLLAWLLWPVSLLYRTMVWLRRQAYRHGLLAIHRPAVPVIVVGNVVAGGSGKTPVTMALVQHLAARGWRPGVVSRGYGRQTQDCREVVAGATPADVGDEALLIAHATGVPVYVAARRVQAVQTLLAAHPATDVVVSDDGLQHLALDRDIELCVFDDGGVGNGFLLPAGPLREPWPRPADLVVHTGRHPAFAGFRVHRELAGEAVRADGTRRSLAGLRTEALHALAGIAHPPAFFDMLRAAGLSLRATTALPDHYAFDSTNEPWDKDQHLICTEKDAVKLWRRRPDAWAVPLVVSLDEGLLERVEALLDQRAGAKLSSAHGRQID